MKSHKILVALTVLGIVLAAGAYPLLKGLNKRVSTLEGTSSYGAINLVGGQRYYLYGSGVGTSDTSITLTSFKQQVTGYKLAMTDFGTIGYLTLEPGSATRQEFVSFTGVSQNSDGTATLTGVSRGLAPVSPYTASSTLQKQHPGGTDAVLSNPPQVYELFANKSNTQYITGAWGFQGTAPTSTVCASANELCNKGYVDSIANAGAATSTETNGGLVELGTALEAASSTDGGADKPLVLQTKNATDTPTYGCATGYTSTAGAGCTVIAQLTGKIKQSWLDLTSLWSFSNLSSASSTFTGNYAIGGLPYTWPTTRGASSTVLTEDGSGVLRFLQVEPPRYTFATTTDIAVTSTTNATSSSLTVPAGFFTASSTVVIKGAYTCAKTGNTTATSCQLAVRDSTGTNFATITQGISGDGSPGTNSTGQGQFIVTIYMNNSLSSQKTLRQHFFYDVAGSSVTADFQGQETSTSLDFSAQRSFVVTLLGTGEGNATLTLQTLMIEANR